MTAPRLVSRDRFPPQPFGGSIAYTISGAGALTACLARHDVLEGDGLHAPVAGRGLAVGRRRRVHVEAEVAGGVATRTISGFLPFPDR